MLLTVPSAANAAQGAVPPSAPPAQVTPADENQIVAFSADEVTYDSNADVVTASGEVRMNREGNYLAADQVIWDRKSGQVYARGNVVMVTPQGDKVVGDNVQLTDTMKDGTVDNLLVVLESGGRIAARHGARVNGVSTFTNAIYTPCPVTKDSGCWLSCAMAPLAAAKAITAPAVNARVLFTRKADATVRFSLDSRLVAIAQAR
jgi:LPS-assembly protein